MDREQAERLARDWIAAWNRHDLDAILSHYEDDIEFFSPLVARLGVDPSGCIRGKAALREYFAGGLARFPELHFELFDVFLGVNSATLHYRSVGNLLAAETLELGAGGTIRRVLAHYRESK